MADITDLGGDVFQLDLQECGIEGLTAGYFVRGKSGWMLLETGPASSAGVVLEATQILGIKPSQMKYLAVTHIHLDHAGGLGLLAKHFREARVVLHPKGSRHMIDPSRLIAGALAAWGREKMAQYGDPVPLAEERVINVVDGNEIDLGDRKLEIWGTPGHCKDHVCFYDVKTNGLFSGDATGIYCPELSQLLGVPVLRPATPAPDFNGQLMVSTLVRLVLSNIDKIYYTHFGVSRSPGRLINIVLGQVAAFMELGRHYKDRAGVSSNGDDGLKGLKTAIEQYIRRSVPGHAEFPEGAGNRVRLEWDLLAGKLMAEMSAKGVWEYLEKAGGRGVGGV